jgi:hypothetical protein
MQRMNVSTAVNCVNDKHPSAAMGNRPVNAIPDVALTEGLARNRTSGKVAQRHLQLRRVDEATNPETAAFCVPEPVLTHTPHQIGLILV